jgi:hypothetical protein
MPQNGRLREIPQKVQKLATHRSLGSGDVGRIRRALTLFFVTGFGSGAYSESCWPAPGSGFPASASRASMATPLANVGDGGPPNFGGGISTSMRSPCHLGAAVRYFQQ